MRIVILVLNFQAKELNLTKDVYTVIILSCDEKMIDLLLTCCYWVIEWCKYNMGYCGWRLGPGIQC